jgi:hypothetical protein
VVTTASASLTPSIALTPSSPTMALTIGSAQLLIMDVGRYPITVLKLPVYNTLCRRSQAVLHCRRRPSAGVEMRGAVRRPSARGTTMSRGRRRASMWAVSGGKPRST